MGYTPMTQGNLRKNPNERIDDGPLIYGYMESISVTMAHVLDRTELNIDYGSYPWLSQKAKSTVSMLGCP